jgi:hypothetical protein
MFSNNYLAGVSVIKIWDQEDPKKFAFSVILDSSLVVAHMMALEAYMVVNFRARGISRGACKLARTPTLN